MKNHKRYVGTVCLGKARKLQAPGSDVSLEIPKGSRGVYVMGVHTDVSKFKNVIEDKECFVSPVVEILHKTEDDIEEPESHTIRIPHCLDASKLQLIQVRRGRSFSNAPFQHISPKHKVHTNDAGYIVDHNYITIFSRKFSEFVCTSCNNTCKGTIRLFLFGNLNAWGRKNVTTVKMKSFLCSPLFMIDDFRQVGILANISTDRLMFFMTLYSYLQEYFYIIIPDMMKYIVNVNLQTCFTVSDLRNISLQHLFDVHKTYKLLPVGESDVKTESRNFDPQQSYVTLKMYPAKTETNNWDPLYNHHAWKENEGYFLSVSI